MIALAWPLRLALFECCIVIHLSQLAMQRSFIATAIVSMVSISSILVPSRQCNPPQKMDSLDDRFDGTKGRFPLAT